MPRKLPPDQHRISVTFRCPPDLFVWLQIAVVEAELDIGSPVTKSEWIAACLEMARSHPHRSRLVREAIAERRQR